MAPALSLILALAAPVLAQAPPALVSRQKPTLKRDRTQRVLYPRILQYEDERVVTHDLIDMLSLSHGGVRRRAAMALGRIGNPVGVTPLVGILKTDRSPEMRALAAFALGEIESHFAVQPLIEHLEEEQDTVVRARIHEALGKIVSNRMSADALGSYVIASIAHIISKSLPTVAESLSDADRLLGSLGLTALIRLRHESSIEPIAAQLSSRDPELRWQAANALARIRDRIETTTDRLLPLLDDPDPLARAHAARALGVARDRRAVPKLIRLLADPDQRVVSNSINALGAIGDSAAVEPLTKLGMETLAAFRAADPEARGVRPQLNLLLTLASAMGNIRDPDALPFLRSLRFVNGYPGTGAEVEIAAASFGEEFFFEMPEGIELPLNNWRAVAWHSQGLGRLATPRATERLVSILASPSIDPRAVPHILRALASAKYAGLRDVLLAQLEAEDVIVRAAAATLLADVADRSDAVFRALEVAMRVARADKQNDARIAVLETASKIGRPMNTQALSGETRDPDYVVRARAAELLRQSGAQESLARNQVGNVESGRDRSYWRRVAELMTSPPNPVAVIHTRKGVIRVELFTADAPLTVDNFVQLAKQGFYDGLSFMRVVPNFVIQGGDPRHDMEGSPGYQIRCEINLKPYVTGSVGMALSGKDTGGSQFFITHSPQPHLDGGYTVFGQVVSGMETVNAIQRDDIIERIEILEQSE